MRPTTLTTLLLLTLTASVTAIPRALRPQSYVRRHFSYPTFYPTGTGYSYVPTGTSYPTGPTGTGTAPPPFPTATGSPKIPRAPNNRLKPREAPYPIRGVVKERGYYGAVTTGTGTATGVMPTATGTGTGTGYYPTGTASAIKKVKRGSGEVWGYGLRRFV